MANSLFLDGKIDETLKWRLHPLIHTFPTKTQHQMLGRKKAEPKTSHFLSLHQNIVAWSQEEKCELKYDIYIFRSRCALQVLTTQTSSQPLEGITGS